MQPPVHASLQVKLPSLLTKLFHRGNNGFALIGAAAT